MITTYDVGNSEPVEGLHVSQLMRSQLPLELHVLVNLSGVKFLLHPKNTSLVVLDSGSLLKGQIHGNMLGRNK
jgi:hypothetical protein